MDILKWDRIQLEDVKTLPITRGCYALLCNETIVYIGRAKLLWSRLSNLNTHKTISKILASLDGEFVLAYSVKDYDNEKELIIKHAPEYNIDYISKFSCSEGAEG